MNYKHLIVAEELYSRLDSDYLRVIDCRFDLMDVGAGREQYRTEHIPGAAYADLDQDLSSPVGAQTGRHPLPDVADAERTLGELGIDDSIQVVVYDGGGGTVAARAWWLLRWLGHEKVALLDGGFERWRKLGYETRSGQEVHKPRTFTASPRPELLMTIDEILANDNNVFGLNLIDARDAARYRGELEPIDPVAGHIPGAINLPLSESLHDDGTWRAPDELMQIWSGTLKSGPETRSAVMCGSGVTACHLVLSAILAGFTEPRVYVGSWSEWIRDPQRPVAKGDS